MADTPDSQDLFPVVGVGASAGGLQALREFLEHTPADCGMAIVVVMHLSAEHESHLAQLLQPHTEMPVMQVTDHTPIARNHVYVIPPNRNLASIDSHLRLSSLEDARAQRAAVDHFLRTLARSHGEQAVAVLLSGSGSDGTVGIKDVKEAGGLILVQEPQEAEFDGMPQSAIATGLVDEVLPAARIGPRLVEFTQRQAQIQAPRDESELGAEERALLQRIFMQLRAGVGHDFSRYKRGTILRRIRRRMQLRGVVTLEAYLQRLRSEPDEVRALYKDLLIVVTNFFREPETYETLGQRALPQLFEEAGPERPIRVWVAGCATGEEVYSLTIVLLEHAAQLATPPPLQIFATDISADALTVARSGLYSSAIEADVSLQRLHRFFVKEQGGYRVRDEVRELVLFARHSLLKDPPFSRLDLISCRNVLIYLQRELQGQILELFHYALRGDGFLFLGTSEGIDDPQLFAPVSARHSLYRRREAVTVPPRLPQLPFSAPESLQSPSDAARRQGLGLGARHHELVERYAPPSVLVDDDHQLLHVSRSAGRYLRVPGGATTRDLLELARDELRFELSSLLHRALSRGQPGRSGPVHVDFDGETRLVTLQVQPARQEGQQAQALVFFLESEPQADAAAEQPGGAQDALVQELQEELAETRRRLRATVEEYEASKEEMKASNEELQSINEELRSMTEELETSKEELHSMNEELLTVNEENRHKVQELSRMSSDLQNLLAATDIATLFLDRELRIQRFTPAASKLFNVRHPDRERPMAHLTHRLVGYDGLIDDARAVLRNLEPVEREVQSDEGRHYLLRALPYRTTRDEVQGVVITLVDVTSLRQAQEALQAVQERYRLLVQSTKEYAMLTSDPEGRIVSWNQGAQRILGYDEEEVLGQPAALIFTPEDRNTEVPEKEMQLAREQGQAPDERWHLRKDGSRFWASGVLTSMWRDGVLQGYAKVLRDNTERKRAEEALRQRERQLTALTETLEERVEQRTMQVRQLAGELVTSEQKVRQRISQVLHDNLQQMLYALEMQLTFFRQDMDPDLPRAQRDALDDMAETIAGALQLTRQLTVELSPPVLRGEGLPEALDWLAEYMRDVYKMAVTVRREGQPHVDDEDQRILLFQIVRELLFNVVKHAEVNEAEVTVSEEEGGVGITVSDRGKGFDPAQVRGSGGSGFGLLHARERVELFGGSLTVRSQPGQGTTVTLFLPHVASGAQEEAE